MDENQKGLVATISEIALRCTAKVCVGFEPARIEAVAAPLADALVDIIIGQGNETGKLGVYHVRATGGFVVFELWNRIIDEIEKEIPSASRIEISSFVCRSERKEYIKKWGPDGTNSQRIPVPSATALQLRGRFEDRTKADG